MKKLTPAQKETWKPAHLPRHYYPGHAFIPKEGYFQVRKVGLTGRRVQIDPRFHKTRLLAKEFAELAAYAKLIRAACCTGTAIKTNNARLHGLLNRALQYDESHCCGSRKLLNGNLEILEGFNFNERALLEETCKIACEVVYHPATKQIEIQLPSFVPEYYIIPPAGIRYCRIYAITADLQIDHLTYTTEIKRTSMIPLKKIHFAAATLMTQSTANIGSLSITALGITWYEERNNKLVVSQKAGPLKIINIDGGNK